MNNPMLCPLLVILYWQPFTLPWAQRDRHQLTVWLWISSPLRSFHLPLCTAVADTGRGGLGGRCVMEYILEPLWKFRIISWKSLESLCKVWPKESQHQIAMEVSFLLGYVCLQCEQTGIPDWLILLRILGKFQKYSGISWIRFIRHWKCCTYFFSSWSVFVEQKVFGKGTIGEVVTPHPRLSLSLGPSDQNSGSALLTVGSLIWTFSLL